MATTGRGMGTRGNVPAWEKHFTPGGMVYWTRANDPGWGYLDDPTQQGLQPDATRRYPIEYINYVWAPVTGDDPRHSRSTASGQQKRELTASALQGRICVPYGRVRIGGNILAWRAVGSFYYVSMAVSHGPIEGFVGVRMLDQDASLVSGAPFYTDADFQFELGLASPAGSPPSYYTVATSSGVVERHPYLATAHCKFNLAGTKGIREAPEPLFTIDGRTLRDPRLGLDGNGIPNQPEAFASNPALALADYYTSSIYGPGVPDDRINWDSVADTADYCDGLVGGLPRHTINWAIMRAASHRSIIQTIKGLGQIVVIRRDGKRVFVPEAAASRVHVFTPSNSMPAEVEKVSLASAPNIVKVTFTNPSKDYADDTVTVMTEDARIGAEPPFPEEYVYEGMNNASEAQRRAAWLLADLRNPLRVSWAGTKAESCQFEPMDRVGYYSPTASLGVSAGDPQDLRVMKTQKRADGTVRFTGKLYDESYFSDATRTTETPPVNTTAPPTQAPDPPTSPTGAGSLTVSDGFTAASTTGFVIVSWTHPGWPYDLRYRVTVQTTGAESTIADVPSGPVQIDARVSPVTVRVYAYVRSTGATSSAVSGTITGATPSAVTGLTFTGDLGVTSEIYFNASASADVVAYKVYKGNLSSKYFFAKIDAANRPTSTTPFNVEPIVDRVFDPIWNQDTALDYDIRVTAVSVVGIESAATQQAGGIAASVSGEAEGVPQVQDSVSLSNGVNSNISIPAGPGAMAITGPTAAFTLGGFAAPGGGTAPWLAVVYTGSQACTIANAHASSSAANRIKTFTGGDIVTRGAFEALFRYDPTDTLWHLVAFNDGTLRFSGGNVGIGATPASPSGFAPIFDLSGTAPAFVLHDTDNSNVIELGANSGKFQLRPASGVAVFNVLSSGAVADTLVLDAGVAQAKALKINGHVTVTDALSGSKTWDPGNITAASFTTTTVTVTGAAVGDKVVGVSHTASQCLTGSVLIVAVVSAANTVTVTIYNANTASVNPDSGTLSVLVVKHT